jgi:hypothetical protein
LASVAACHLQEKKKKKIKLKISESFTLNLREDVSIFGWDLILVQHQYNNSITIPHMKVGPSMWDPLSCEGLLYSCCIGVVNLTFSYLDYPEVRDSMRIVIAFDKNYITLNLCI